MYGPHTMNLPPGTTGGAGMPGKKPPLKKRSASKKKSLAGKRSFGKRR